MTSSQRLTISRRCAQTSAERFQIYYSKNGTFDFFFRLTLEYLASVSYRFKKLDFLKILFYFRSIFIYLKKICSLRGWYTPKNKTKILIFVLR